MSIIGIRAFLECDGCGAKLTFDLDPAEKIPEGWTLFDLAIDACRGGASREDGFTSVQGDNQCLCGACTATVDAHVTEDRAATEDEVRAALEENAA